MNQDLKRYLVSSAYTFVAVFLGVLLANWKILNQDIFSGTLWVTTLLTCVRASIKFTGEYLLPLVIEWVKGKIK